MDNYFDLVLQDAAHKNFTLRYDPFTSHAFWDHTGEDFDLSHLGVTHRDKLKEWGVAHPISPDAPAGKSRTPKSIKIQLGLKCNYACTYCNQRSQPHDGDGNPRAVDAFIRNFPKWFDLGDGTGVTIEFWGGEPLVYWKTLKPLAEGIRALYANAEFNIITNGSLLDREKIDWLDAIGFGVGISHDGPAYEAGRGADPLLDPEQLRWIRYAFDVLAPAKRIGFNCVLSTQNMSLVAVRDYIAHHLGVAPEDVPLTTEEILLPYEDGGVSLSLLDATHAKRLTHVTFYEAIMGMSMSVSTVESKAKDFLKSIADQRPASSLGQKCGMDREDNIAVDLNGNVMTCQNTSPLTKHNIGHLNAFDTIRLRTAHHWSTRQECVKCPLVQLCRGACLFLEGDLWKKACDNSFAYNLGILAASMFFATGMILVGVRGHDLRGSGATSVDVIEGTFLKTPLPSWYFPDSADIDARSVA